MTSLNCHQAKQQVVGALGGRSSNRLCGLRPVEATSILPPLSALHNIPYSPLPWALLEPPPSLPFIHATKLRGCCLHNWIHGAELQAIATTEDFTPSSLAAITTSPFRAPSKLSPGVARVTLSAPPPPPLTTTTPSSPATHLYRRIHADGWRVRARRVSCHPPLLLRCHEPPEPLVVNLPVSHCRCGLQRTGSPATAPFPAS
uniref:Uncharacterized protein n=1 Tax=Oryza barthii TaxID=65489 RepID=A0A0D3FVU5_9ORYZ